MVPLVGEDGIDAVEAHDADAQERLEQGMLGIGTVSTPATSKTVYGVLKAARGFRLS